MSDGPRGVVDVLITVDVEHGGSAYAREHPEVRLQPSTLDCVVDGTPWGLPFIVQTLAANGLTGTFFVEPLARYYYGDKPLGEALDLIRQGGMNVQLHVHPTWLRFADGRERPDTLFSFPAREQEEIVKAGQGILEEHGVRSDAFRAGGFAANNDTYSVLSNLGIACSSSYNLSYLQSSCRIRVPEKHNTPFEVTGLLEVPITNFLIRDMRKVFRHVEKHFQVGSTSAAHARAVLDRAHEAGLTSVNILLHNFEFVRRDRPDWFLGPFQKHEGVVAAFHDLCAFLAANRDRFRPRTFADLATAWRGGVHPDPAAPLILPKISGIYLPL